MKYIFTLLFISLFINVAVQAQTRRFVKPTASGSGDGSSWANASAGLQGIINASAPGDSVFVAGGNYQPVAGQSFSMKEGVKIYGHFAGTEASLAQRNLNNASVSFLIGNGNSVIRNSGLSDAAKIDGFTIKNGNSGSNGGGMYNSAASPAVSNCIITNNSVSGGGGGMYNASNSSPTIKNCIFTNNAAVSSVGGGIANSSSSPTIINSVFYANTAYYGGAIYNNSNSSPNIANCNFVNNTATAYGAMYNYFSSSPNINNCTFTGNTATLDNFAIYNSNNCLTQITNSIIYGNSGGISDFNSTSTITYSIVQGGYTGTGNMNVDPLWVNAGNPVGADGLWGTADDGLQMKAFSPAMNSGNNASFPTGIATDITGSPRIQNGIIDLGAYEFQPGNFCTNTVIVYVDGTNGNDANNGSSWAMAFKTLSVALLYSQVCNVTQSILVAQGTYYPTGEQNGINRDQTFLIFRGGLKIYGGYPAGGGSRNVAAYPTILSGNIGNPNITTDNSYHVLAVAGLAVGADSVVVDGLTLTRGNGAGANGNVFLNGASVDRLNGAGAITADNNGNTKIAFKNCTFYLNSASAGGGIYNQSSSPNIINCAFNNNSGGQGGGMFNNSSFPILTNCTFSNNSSTSGLGGGMLNYSSSPILDNCIFSNNTGSGMFNTASSSPHISNTSFNNNNGTSGGGGGVVNMNSSPIFNNCSFTGNTSPNFGGGMYNSSSSPDITNSSFTNNSSGNGGGMYNDGSSNPNITLCSFIGNSATADGGGVYNLPNSSPNIANSNFSNNTAANKGGGMYNNQAHPTVSNCIFSTNTAREGGGIFNNYGSLSLKNSTLKNNKATNQGGGGMENFNATTVEIINCNFNNNTANSDGGGVLNLYTPLVVSNATFSNNTANTGGGIYIYSSNTSINNSIIYGNNTGIYVAFGAAPTISNSNIQGGYSGTGNINADPLFADAANGNYHLSCGSPCINAGNNTNVITGVSKDLDGSTRIQGGTVDMGAYEGAWPGTNSLAGGYFSYYKDLQAGTVSYGACGGLLTTVTSTGNSPLADSVGVSVWVETNQPLGFVKRHYQIQPFLNASSATATITLYFTQQEFDDFNAVNVHKLPTGPSDVTGKANLLIEKRGGVSSDGSGNPNTYSGSVTIINPIDTNIIWNAINSRWEVTFDVVGFSGFWVKTQSSVLPVTLISFSGIKTRNANKLTWQVSNEINMSKYELESSKDAGTFTTIYTEAAQNKTTYSYVDDNAVRNRNRINYYRLKMIDADGTAKHSNIVALLNSQQGIEIVNLAPNPAKDKAILNVTGVSISKIHINILDAAGRTVWTKEYALTAGSNQLEMNLKKLSGGIYYLQVITTDGSGKIIRFVKE